MKLSLALILSVLSLSCFAEVPVDATKLTLSLDKKLFKDCISSLRPYQSGTEYCVLADIPEDQEFLADDGLLASLQYVQMASEMACDNDFRLYTGIDRKLNKIVIITEGKECLQTMAKWNADLGYPYLEKSVFFIKK